MSYTVKESLKLNSMKNFHLVAGYKGLSREILYPSILDHEGSDAIRENVLPGEFIISNLLILKDKPEQLLGFIERLISSKAACFALKTIYFKDFPEEIIHLADRYDFPLFTFDNTYIEDIIVDMDKAIHAGQHMNWLQMIVNRIMESDLSESQIRGLSLEINSRFKNTHVIYYSKPKNIAEKVTHLNYNKLTQLLPDTCSSLEFKNGLLTIITYNSGNSVLEATKAALINSGITEKTFITGISTTADRLEDINRTLKESFFACNYAELNKCSQARFNEMGIYKLLMPLKNEKWAILFYKSIINRLVDYDSQNKTDLLETAVSYVLNSGNIRLTAKKLYQHENTVRYRIRKIYQIIGIQDYFNMGYETLSIAVKMYLLNVNI